MAAASPSVYGKAAQLVEQYYDACRQQRYEKYQDLTLRADPSVRGDGWVTDVKESSLSPRMRIGNSRCFRLRSSV